MAPHRLTDREWLRLAPLLPPKSRRISEGNRLILGAMLWLAKTGAPWRDLPERFGPWRTVATRFFHWTCSKLWDRVLAELRRIADAAGGIDWDVHLVDGTSVRARRCAADLEEITRDIAPKAVLDELEATEPEAEQH